VGYPNHVNGERARFGVWCEGQLAWTDAPEWTVAMAYEPGCLVGVTTLTHHGWQIRLTITEAVDPDQPVHVRRIVAENLAGRGRNIRVFLHAYLEIGRHRQLPGRARLFVRGPN
jgi:GH15 family glucan-1,4-alpha-glucosidase